MVLMGVIGVVIERFAYRPLRHAPRLAPLITAIGVSFILQNIIQVAFGPSPHPTPQIFPRVDVLNVPDITIGGWSYPVARPRAEHHDHRGRDPADGRAADCS